MRTRPTVAIMELLLIVPATLFMGALFLRAVQPIMGTGRLVDWFSHHVLFGLYVFLVAMPLAAFIVGSATVVRSWRRDAAFRRDAVEVCAIVRANGAFLLIGISTLMAAGILTIVAMHMITE
ncbi:MAG TPA: hypothetical protein VGD54_16410 [Steroidobacteraceae bacterium]